MYVQQNHQGWSIRHYDEVGSTQDVVKSCIDADAASDPEVIPYIRHVARADSQRSGRGRHGREWVSSQGNLFVTFAITPDLPLSNFGLYAYIGALALSDAARFFDSEDRASIELKWPNDLMINDQKAAGILMEHYNAAERDYLVIGIGVNLKGAPEGKSILQECFECDDIPPAKFLEKLLEGFDHWEKVLNQQGAAAIIAPWQNRAWRLDQLITAKLGDQRISGQFDHIDEIGSMIIQLETGEKRRITAGELYFGDEMQPEIL
jgi:BirA family biotin operon repressor/biotin-[acetyl-CoA-carboxylase] ligase